MSETMEKQPAFVLPVLLTLMTGHKRLNRYRATLVSGNNTIWRCDCNAHKTIEQAKICGGKELKKRQRHSQQRMKDDGFVSANLSKGDK